MDTSFWTTIRKFFKDANVFGLHVPMISDPKTGTGSVSLTLLFISANLVVFGLVGQWCGLVHVPLESTLEFFYASSALYFGRKWTGKTNAIDPNQPSEKTPPR